MRCRIAALESEVHQLRNLLGQLAGSFSLDSTTYPSSYVKYNPVTTGTLLAGTVNTFTDTSAEFVSNGLVTSIDVVRLKLNKGKKA